MSLDETEELVREQEELYDRGRKVEEEANWIVTLTRDTYIVMVTYSLSPKHEIMEDLGLNVVLPPFLNGRRQFTSSKANQSRYRTKIRWMVETVSARIRQFKLFANTIQNSSLPYLREYLFMTIRSFKLKNPRWRRTNFWNIKNVDQLMDNYSFEFHRVGFSIHHLILRTIVFKMDLVTQRTETL